jgi:hypothetical protein
MILLSVFICLISVICVLLYFNGTLITQMVMINYDFVISVYLLNQRHLRSILFQWNADNADDYDKI